MEKPSEPKSNFAVTGLYFLAAADFVAAMQLMIYVGGTLVLLVFGVMLTARGPFVSMKITPANWLMAGLAGGALLILLLCAAVSVDAWKTAAVAESAIGREGGHTVARIGMALLGSVAISWADLGRGGSQWLGNLLALTGAVMVAGYLMIGRRARASRSLVAYSGLVYAMAAATLLLLSALTGQALLGFSPKAYLWVLGMALVSQLVGHSVLNWALRHISATYVAMVTMAEPIGSGILALLLFREAVPLSTVLGGALILAGIYVASRRELRR